MRFVTRRQPSGDVDVSLVLLDWACRESYHVLDYLAEQTHPRRRFEVIWIEFYPNVNDELARRAQQPSGPDKAPAVDTLCVLEMPPGTCYHKHLMYNVGIALAAGRVVCVLDSDAMLRPTFVQSIVESFRCGEAIALHLDEFRNNDPRFHPFRRPSFEEVTGYGCINALNGTTTGLLDRADPLHHRNYGACFAARREDLIAIGGADMHEDYLGHICGPYDMTFRLANAGKPERWCRDEWLYHVWHPGQAGDRCPVGPHDGLQMSSRSLLARRTGRVMPYVEHPAIARLREGGPAVRADDVLDGLVQPNWARDWCLDDMCTVPREYKLGRRTIRLSERAGDGQPSAPPATLGPLYGRRLPREAKFRLLPLLAGMVWRQVGIKRRVAPWSRPGSPKASAREFRRKLGALVSFLRRVAGFNRHWVRQCWLALAYAAQEGHRSVFLFGQGDLVRVLGVLAPFANVRIRGVLPFVQSPPRRPDGLVTVCPTVLPGRDEPVILAAAVNLPARLAQLQQLGVPRERVITLH